MALRSPQTHSHHHGTKQTIMTPQFRLSNRKCVCVCVNYSLPVTLATPRAEPSRALWLGFGVEWAPNSQLASVVDALGDIICSRMHRHECANGQSIWNSLEQLANKTSLAEITLSPQPRCQFKRKPNFDRPTRDDIFMSASALIIDLMACNCIASLKCKLQPTTGNRKHLPSASRWPRARQRCFAWPSPSLRSSRASSTSSRPRATRALRNSAGRHRWRPRRRASNLARRSSDARRRSSWRS